MERDPEVGEIIAAKEKSGNKFYRAEIVSKIDHEHFNVCFIDFGYWDTIHKSNIVQPTEFQVKLYIYLFSINKLTKLKWIYILLFNFTATKLLTFIYGWVIWTRFGTYKRYNSTIYQKSYSN